jgi:hypothetical protein
MPPISAAPISTAAKMVIIARAGRIIGCSSATPAVASPGLIVLSVCIFVSPGIADRAPEISFPYPRSYGLPYSV